LFFNGQQIGIVSWSADPCAQSIPDVYTEVTWFIDWIEFGKAE
jgi:secreted trypsin-like serine protease